MSDQSRPSTVVDFSVLRSAIMRATPWVILSTIVISATTYGFLSTLSPSFTSDAQLLIGGRSHQDPFRETKDNRVNGVAVAASIDKEAVLSQVKILQSGDIAAALIDEFNLDANPFFNTALQPPGILAAIRGTLGLADARVPDYVEDRVQRAYYRALTVAQAKDTRVIGIEFTTTDQELSARLANRLAELYIAGLTDKTVEQTAGASIWLATEIDRLRQEVENAEADVEAYRAGKGLVAAGPDKLTLDSQRLAELNAELGRAQSERSAAESRTQLIRSMMRNGGAEAAPEVLRSPLIQRLVEQRVRIERQVSELATALMPGHPRMRQLRGDLAGINRLIGVEVGKVAQSLDQEMQAAGLRESAVKQQLDALKKRVEISAADEVKLRDLEREAKSKRDTLEYYLARHADASARQDMRAVPPEAELISRARPSSVPSFPKKLPMTFLAATGSLLLGFAWVMTRALLSGQHVPLAPAPARDLSLSQPKLTEAARKQQALAQTLRDRPPPTTVLRSPAHHTSMVSVGCHVLRQASGAGGGYHTLVSGELAPTSIEREARELARILSKAGGEVILVALDVVQSQGRAVDRPRAGSGFYDLVAGRGSFETAISAEPGNAFHVLAAGSALASAAALDPERTQAMLDSLGAAYDHVIVWGSPDAALDLLFAAAQRFDIGIEVNGRTRLAGRRDSVRFLGIKVFGFESLRLTKVPDTRAAREQTTGSAQGPALRWKQIREAQPLQRPQVAVGA